MDISTRLPLIYLSAQPATDYYAWQVEVYLNNFTSMGIDEKDIYVVAAIDNDLPASWLRCQRMYPKANFIYAEDTRENKGYAPSIQPHILKKVCHKFPKNCAIFYHDCDFLFTRPMNFDTYRYDNICILSDTISYIGAKYIKSKGEDVLLKMCDLAGIDHHIVEANEMMSGGAQKLLKGVDADYWQEVEDVSNALYFGLGELKDKKSDGDPYGVQIWCASMWAELWCLWKRGIETKVVPEFDFAWATCGAPRWDKVSFYHNAGAIDDSTGMFVKGKYVNVDPIGLDIKGLDPNRCSYLYWKWIENSAKKRLNLQ
jgi:hypothetical protein